MSVYEWVGITASEGARNLVVVTHLGPVKAMVADALGGHWDAFERVIVGHASVSTLEIGQDAARLVDLNLAPRRETL
jgi:broad specificity phosphatase PhoE